MREFKGFMGLADSNCCNIDVLVDFRPVLKPRYETSAAKVRQYR